MLSWICCWLLLLSCVRSRKNGTTCLSCSAKKTGKGEKAPEAPLLNKAKSGWVDRACKAISNIEHFGRSDIFNTMNKHALLQVNILMQKHRVNSDVFCCVFLAGWLIMTFRFNFSVR